MELNDLMTNKFYTAILLRSVSLVEDSRRDRSLRGLKRFRCAKRMSFLLGVDDGVLVGFRVRVNQEDLDMKVLTRGFLFQSCSMFDMISAFQDESERSH